MPRRNRFLTEMYSEILQKKLQNETANMFDAVRKIVETEPVENIEIQTHYGNSVLPIKEVWVQDGTLKISVAGKPESVDEDTAEAMSTTSEEAAAPVKEPVTVPTKPSTPTRPHPLQPSKPGISPRPKAEDAGDVNKFINKRQHFFTK